MSLPHVQATITVTSEDFHQTFEESLSDSKPTDASLSYADLIAANERLKTNISKVLTEFVDKERATQQTTNEHSKRKQECNDRMNKRERMLFINVVVSF
jgi:hypothetical protein